MITCRHLRHSINTHLFMLPRLTTGQAEINMLEVESQSIVWGTRHGLINSNLDFYNY